MSAQIKILHYVLEQTEYLLGPDFEPLTNSPDRDAVAVWLLPHVWSTILAKLQDEGNMKKPFKGPAAKAIKFAAGEEE